MPASLAKRPYRIANVTSRDDVRSPFDSSFDGSCVESVGDK